MEGLLVVTDLKYNPINQTVSGVLKNSSHKDLSIFTLAIWE
jgi:hypothetical protein